MEKTLQANTQKNITVQTKDLPLHCPMPNMLKWNAHPRVFLDIAPTGTARCPYCGTLYQLAGGGGARHHH